MVDICTFLGLLFITNIYVEISHLNKLYHIHKSFYLTNIPLNSLPFHSMQYLYVQVIMYCIMLHFLI